MKILKISGIVLALLIVLLLALPFLFRGKIISAAKQAANDNLEARLDFDGLSLSLIRSFPNLHVGISKLSIINTKAPFEGDTLIYLGNFSVVTNISPLWTGKPFEILSLKLNDAIVKALVSKDGAANWDIAKPSEATAEEADTTEAAPFHLSLKKLSLKNGRILYDDRTMDFRFEAAGIDNEMSGDLTLSVYDLLIKMMIEKTDVWYGGVHYLNSVKTNLDALMNIDMDSMKFSFKNNKLLMNDLALQFDGFFAMPADTVYDMDISMKAPDAQFKQILSLIPAIFMKDYKGLKADGNLVLNAFVRGRYDFSENLPAFGIVSEIKNGAFQYPAMPAAISALNMKLDIQNPGGVADLTTIAINPFSLNVDGQPFSGFFNLRRPISSPFVDLGMKGRLDLEKMRASIPLPENNILKGLINADMTAKGALKSLEQGKYEDFAAAGFVEVSAIEYRAPETPVTKIPTGRMDFNNRKVSVSNLAVFLDESDLKMEGSVEDFFPYMLSGGTLKGALDIQSNYFNANSFLSDESETAASQPEAGDTLALEAFVIPANLDLRMSMKAAKIDYSTYTLTNSIAALRVQNSALLIDQMQSDLLGGTIGMKGSYRSRPDGKPVTSFNMSLKNIGAKELFKSTATIKAMAPVFNYIGGNINLNLGFDDLLLNEKLEPQLNTLNASGLFEILDGSLSGMPSQQQLASTLKMESLNNLNLKKVMANFDIVNGLLILREFPINTASDVKMSFGGIQKLTSEMEYLLKMQVPRGKVGLTDNAIGGLTSAAGSVIPGFKVPETLNIDVLIEGTPANPVFKPRLSGFGNDLKDQAKEAVQAEIDRQKEEAERRLMEEKQKIEAEVERQKKELENKATEEKERLLREIEEKKKQEEQRLKEEAEKQKKKLLKDIMGK